MRCKSDISSPDGRALSVYTLKNSTSLKKSEKKKKKYKLKNPGKKIFAAIPTQAAREYVLGRVRRVIEGS